MKNGIRFGILIREENVCNGEYYVINGFVVTVDAAGHVRNGLNSDDPINGLLAIENLRVDAQGDNTSREKGVYGYSYRYRDVYRVDEDYADRMLKTLRVLRKRLDKMYERRGSARSFGEYVGRVAEAMGKDSVVIQTIRTGSFYSEGEYRFMTPGEGAGYVDGLVEKWQKGGQ